MKVFSMTDLGTHKNEIIKELKNADYNGPEDTVFRKGLIYD